LLDGPESNLYFLDTRSFEEYKVSHIKGAYFVGYKKFKMHHVEDISKDAAVIVYCSVGVRSEKIGDKLLRTGYQNVYNLYGGVFEWVNQGFSVFDENGKTEKIHGYSKKWSK
jgi:rhodanese-related sulfurtransferase